MLHRTLLKMGLLPPLFNILLVLLGLWLLRRAVRLNRPRWPGYACCLLGVISLYLLATPFVANRLAAHVEIAPALNIEAPGLSANAAIVVLGSGHFEYRSEYDSPWPDNNAIARLNYAADLHRRSQLPLLLSGGQPQGSEHRHAEVMATYLQRMHFVRAKWVEGRSRTTEDNAAYSSKMLAAAGVDEVVLVTQSVHMRRSILLFERAGLKVIPAPTELAEQLPAGVGNWLVSTRALNTSYMALHEVLGYLWYKLGS